MFDSKRVFQGCQDLGFPLLALYLQHGRTFESCQGDGCIASLLEKSFPPVFSAKSVNVDVDVNVDGIYMEYMRWSW